MLPAGTYRDYEQARSNPLPIVERGILARIDDYEKEYARYILSRDKAEAVAS